MKIGIVVGEISGDDLASNLIIALRQFIPELSFVGILGPRLIELGGKVLFPMETINVVGLIEPLKRLPKIYAARKQLIHHFKENPPDIFIGVDAPDFNLGLEKILRESGILTAHYVSPTVWAWRKGRIHKIKKAVDLMLTLFPFETAIYEQAQIPAVFTGHPLADQIPMEIDTELAKVALGYERNQRLLALLPGSRASELKNHAALYIETAEWCYAQDPSLQFLMPLVNETHVALAKQILAEKAPTLPLKIYLRQAQQVIAASDAALVAAGTATLEVMLHKKPMVVAYRLNPLTYQIAKRLIQVPYIALPNLLAGECWVPEFIQAQAQPVRMGQALLAQLQDQVYQRKIKEKFLSIHQTLGNHVAEKAASAIVNLLKRA